MANWYLCEVIKAGSPLAATDRKGKKVYAKRHHKETNFVMVLSLATSFDVSKKIHRFAAEKCLKIIKRLNDSQSKKLDLLWLDAEYLLRPKRVASYKERSQQSRGGASATP